MFIYMFNLLVITLEFWMLVGKIVVTFFKSIVREYFPPKRKNVSGQVVLITGAAKGLGREMALKFARLGSELVLWDIDKESLERTGRDVQRLGARVHTYVVDVSDYGSVATTADKVLDDIGLGSQDRCIDILINNAAVLKVSSLLDLSPGEIKKCVNVNLLGHFWTIKSFLPSMLHHNHGHIVAIGSNLGIVGKAHFSDYSASKHGVMGLMESLTEELHQLKKNGIKLTCICPAAITTGLCRVIETRFPRIFPILEPAYAASLIVDSIRRNDFLLIIPPAYKYLYAFLANCPQRVTELIADYLGNTTEID